MTVSVDLFGRPARERQTARQLPLPLGWRFDDADATALLVSESNAPLVQAVQGIASWSTPVALLIGPPRSGKSLLAAHVLAQNEELHIIDSATSMSEAALFHLCTAALAGGKPVLVVAEPDWQPVLPDLRTRIAAAQDFRVPDPDTELLAALLERRLSNARLQLSPGVAAYVAQRIERSFASVDAVASALTAAALDGGRPLSLTFARETLRTVGLLLHGDEPSWAAA